MVYPLQPASPPDNGSPRPSPRSAAATVALSRALLGHLAPLTDRLVEAILRADGVYREHHLVPHDDLWRSCHDNLAEGISAIAAVSSGDPFDTPCARMTGRRRAEQGMPLENLLHAFRVGGRIIWEGMLEECRRRPEPPIDELMEGAVLVWDANDLHASAVADEYRRTEAELLSRDGNRRRTLLHGLLTGMAGESDIAHAADVLGLRGIGPYVVAVADPMGEPTSSHHALATLLTEHGMTAEWLTRQERLVAVVATRGRAPDAVRDCLDGPGRRRVGLSPPLDDLSQLAGAYRQAELALRSIPANRFEVSTLDDRLTSALLVASPELARRLVLRVLGPVLSLPRHEQHALLTTLEAYLLEGGSVTAVARRLRCHRNTVSNRIARLRDCVGMQPADPRAMAELMLALQAVELVGVEGDARADGRAEKPLVWA